MKPYFRKHHFDYPLHQCWYCQGRPDGICYESDFSEVRTCKACFVKILKKWKRQLRKNLKAQAVSQNEAPEPKKAHNSLVDFQGKSTVNSESAGLAKSGMSLLAPADVNNGARA